MRPPAVFARVTALVGAITLLSASEAMAQHYIQLENLSGGTCLNVEEGSSAPNTETHQYYCDSSNPANLWEWIPGPAGDPAWRQLRNVQAGTCLNVENGSSEPNANTHQYYCDPNNPANLWRWSGDGTWRQLENRQAGTCLNVEEGSSEPNTNTHQYYCDPNNPANLWVERGQVFQLENLSGGTCLNVEEGSSAPNTETHQYYCDSSNPANLWEWIPGPAGDPAWRQLRNVQAGTCLNVENGSSEPNANTHQYYCDPNNPANLWRWSGDGTWRQLENKQAGTCLNVEEGSSAPNANTHQYYCDPNNPANVWSVLEASGQD